MQPYSARDLILRPGLGAEEIPLLPRLWFSAKTKRKRIRAPILARSWLYFPPTARDCRPKKGRNFLCEGWFNPARQNVPRVYQRGNLPTCADF